jgi:hypothetical protein
MVAGIAHGELSNDETEAGAWSLLWSVERGIYPQGNDRAGDWVWKILPLQTNQQCPLYSKRVLPLPY